MSAWLAPLAGGLLIGLSVAMLLLLNGRIEGVSGIVAGMLSPSRATGAGVLCSLTVSSLVGSLAGS